jgi:hypothetical protein
MSFADFGGGTSEYANRGERLGDQASRGIDTLGGYDPAVEDFAPYAVPEVRPGFAPPGPYDDPLTWSGLLPLDYANQLLDQKSWLDRLAFSWQQRNNAPWLALRTQNPYADTTLTGLGILASAMFGPLAGKIMETAARMGAAGGHGDPGMMDRVGFAGTETQNRQPKDVPEEQAAPAESAPLAARRTPIAGRTPVEVDRRIPTAGRIPIAVDGRIPAEWLMQIRQWLASLASQRARG